MSVRYSFGIGGACSGVGLSNALQYFLCVYFKPCTVTSLSQSGQFTLSFNVSLLVFGLTSSLISGLTSSLTGSITGSITSSLTVFALGFAFGLTCLISSLIFFNFFYNWFYNFFFNFCVCSWLLWLYFFNFFGYRIIININYVNLSCRFIIYMF